MTDKKGPGRPANGDYPIKAFARISKEHQRFLLENFDSISDGIRAAVDCLIERATERKPGPDPRPSSSQ